MKQRTGFVSNSSSSSFIIGAGLVTDKPKFEAEFPGWDSGTYYEDFEFFTIKQLKEKQLNSWSVKAKYLGEKPVRVTVDSFTYDEVCTPDLSDCSDDDIVVIYHGGNSLDECDFLTWNEDEDDYDHDCDPDYDVDIEQFSADEQKAFDMFGSDFIAGDASYGAGFNG